jgi:kinesin family protein 2/24
MQGNYNAQDYGQSHSKIPKIRVVIRKRPLNSKEISRKDDDVLNVKDPQSLVLKEIK